MDRLELVELIEAEVAKLSAEGKDLWNRIELLVQAPPPGGFEAMASSAREVLNLSHHDQAVIDRLHDLLAGLYFSDEAEHRGEPGETHRNSAIIGAAGSKDRNAGSQIDPDMTLEQAVTRLKEPG